MDATETQTNSFQINYSSEADLPSVLGLFEEVIKQKKNPQ